MLAFPPAKINLGLNILRRRPDGYHDLETIFLAIPLRDALEIVFDPSLPPASSPVFTGSGLEVEGPASENICVHAYRLMQADYPQLPPARIHLHKVIPMGAGLGGGSSDGAHTLMLLNRMAGLGLSPDSLRDYALTLGSDCPFFMYGQPCFATGRGEEMEPVTLDLTGYRLVLVNPGIHVSTATAFRGILPSVPEISARDIIRTPVAAWRETLVNDFERTIFPEYPEIGQIKQKLYTQGAVYASMSGSGSSVYGIFDAGTRPGFGFPDQYRVFQFDL
jgi:4-diphosphocytidyl-2-C-methyl-D-erythritol kinase